MAMVTPLDSYYARLDAERKNKEILRKQEEVIEYLIKCGDLTDVELDDQFVKSSGWKRTHKGFFLDSTLKTNLDDYLVPAIDAKWDGLFIMSGMEGSGKSTFASAVCRYLDPTFPGERIDEDTPRRKCDRIVFSPAQFFEAVDKAKPKQAIQFDEAILGLLAGDAGTYIQRMLMKKITLIRKKQLYIVLVIPSIFSMRMPIAVQRSRFLLHTYSPDGKKRGYFKFYNMPQKRKLYIKGKRDYNQGAVEPNFRGKFTDTEGLFYDTKEYEKKKEETIQNLTEAAESKKGLVSGVLYKTMGQRNILISYLYTLLEGNEAGKRHLESLISSHNKYAMASKPGDKLNPRKFAEFLKQVFGDHLDISENSVRDYLKHADEYMAKKPEPLKPLTPKDIRSKFFSKGDSVLTSDERPLQKSEGSTPEEKKIPIANDTPLEDEPKNEIEKEFYKDLGEDDLDNEPSEEETSEEEPIEDSSLEEESSDEESQDEKGELEKEEKVDEKEEDSE